MKTTEFLRESAEKYEYDDEAGMVKNNLHTIVRASAELAKSLKDNEDVPEWVQEKIAQAKGMMQAVSDYIASQHEMGHQPAVPGFDADSAERTFAESLKENASAGATGASSVAVSMETLGDKGSFSRQDVIKRLGSYGNKPRGAGPVKLGKTK